jgi:hypothetical protein
LQLRLRGRTNLVFQGSDDFVDYGLDSLGVKIQQIGGGSKLRDGCDIIMGTFQSLVNPSRFQKQE